MNKVLYKETQSLWWVSLILIFLGGQLLLSGIFQWGSKPIPLGVAIPLSVLIILPALLVYNLTIEITEKYAYAKFGIGLLKRKVLMKDLDLSKAEITSLSLASGVGYRYGSRGLFLNTKPGPALFIPSRNGKKHFFVGTKNGEELIALLKNYFS